MLTKLLVVLSLFASAILIGAASEWCRQQWEGRHRGP
jgi:hypothetical protein